MSVLKMWLKEQWGWVVVVTSFCNYFVGFGVLYSYGLLYIALQEEFNSANAETAWIGSIAIGLSGLVSIVSNGLVQKFGSRTVGYVGILLSSTGCIITSFMPYLIPIYFTFGVLMGCGLNFVLISSMQLILRYFAEENASRATSFAIAGTTSGMLAFNPVVHVIITHWGWRNMLRIMGSLILFIGIPCVTTYTQPHPRFLNPIQKPKDISKGLDKEKDSQPVEFKIESTVERRQSRRQSKMEFDKTFKEQLQVLLFPDMWFFAVAIVGSSMAVSFYYISLVSFMNTNGHEKKDSAMVMTVVALSELCGKLLLSAIGDNFPFPRIFLFNIASVLGICVMFGLFFAKSLWMMYCLAIVTGLLVMSVFDTVMYSIGVEVFGPERTIETSTVLLIANGVGITLGSLFGMSVDNSGSYDAAIYANISIYIISIVFYMGVPIYQKLFAKDRYIMIDFKEKKRAIKENPEKEITLEEQIKMI